MSNIKQPQDHKKSEKGKKAKAPTSAKDWKQAKAGTPLEVPSGNTALVRAPGLEVFLKQGLIPNSLLPIIQEAISSGKPPEMDKVEVTGESLEEMVSMVNAVAIYCTLEPAISPIPLDEDDEPLPFSDRDEDLLYVDEVDLQDKLFIFQFAIGGTRDLESFRAAQAAGVESLSAVPAVPFSPESAPQD